jgi:hypothetical protein
VIATRGGQRDKATFHGVTSASGTSGERASSPPIEAVLGERGVRRIVIHNRHGRDYFGDLLRFAFGLAGASHTPSRTTVSM